MVLVRLSHNSHGKLKFFLNHSKLCKFFPVVEFDLSPGYMDKSWIQETHECAIVFTENDAQAWVRGFEFSGYLF